MENSFVIDLIIINWIKAYDRRKKELITLTVTNIAILQIREWILRNGWIIKSTKNRIWNLFF